MTLNDIRHIDRDFLTPAEVAGVLNCTPQLLRVQARENPALIGFHFCMIGNRMKIPRESFIRWMQDNS